MLPISRGLSHAGHASACVWCTQVLDRPGRAEGHTHTAHRQIKLGPSCLHIPPNFGHSVPLLKSQRDQRGVKRGTCCTQRGAHAAHKEGHVLHTKRGTCCTLAGDKQYSHLYAHPDLLYRVGQNHIFTVYIQCFWQGNYEIYGHIQCNNIFMVSSYLLYLPWYRSGFRAPGR